MRKMIITKGLPASGKSTWARKMVAKHPGSYKIVCRDDLREMLDVSKYSKANEKFVVKMQNTIIEEVLVSGRHVIVADTNLVPSTVNRLQTLADDISKEHGFEVQVEFKDFTDVPVEECIKRDLNRANSVGKDVIMRMYNQHLKEDIVPVQTPMYDNELVDCVIFDIDGTLAQKSDRSPFDWHRVGEDTVNTPVGHLFDFIMNGNVGDTKIVIFSGRDSACRAETEEWLNDNIFHYDLLAMRDEGDCRKDSIIKRELYEKHIKGKYNVLFIVDDRNQVVDMWRNELGLPCFQVAEGDF